MTSFTMFIPWETIWFKTDPHSWSSSPWLSGGLEQVLLLPGNYYDNDMAGGPPARYKHSRKSNQHYACVQVLHVSEFSKSGVIVWSKCRLDKDSPLRFCCIQRQHAATALTSQKLLDYEQENTVSPTISEPVQSCTRRRWILLSSFCTELQICYKFCSTNYVMQSMRMDPCAHKIMIMIVSKEFSRPFTKPDASAAAMCRHFMVLSYWTDIGNSATACDCTAPQHWVRHS